MFTKDDLKKFQSESLDQKFQRTLAKVSEWYLRWDNEVYVAFSGGKDSTVLADICARWCKIANKTLYLVFVNTGLEYPEIQKHVKFFAGWLEEKYGIEVELEITRPEMRFDEVVAKYGYPVIGKRQANAVRLARENIKDKKYTVRLRSLGVTQQGAKEMGLELPDREMLERYEKTTRDSKFKISKYNELLFVDFDISEVCCDVMKKKPSYQYAKRTRRKPLIATMAEESATRETAWLKNGCNAFEGKNPKSVPMSFWTEQDVLRYIKEENIPIAPVYGEVQYAVDPEQMRIEEMVVGGCGCEKLCTSGCSRTGCIFCAFGAHTEKGESRFQQLKKTHPKQYSYCLDGGAYNENGVWKPNKQGLGMRHVFEELNRIYGDGFIKY